MLHGETLHSALPQDIPWWMPDHAVFFGVFYGVLLAVGCGLAYVAYRTCKDTCKGATTTGTSGH